METIYLVHVEDHEASEHEVVVSAHRQLPNAEGELDRWADDAQDKYPDARIETDEDHAFSLFNELGDCVYHAWVTAVNLEP